jgi:hypothetical protein
VRRLLIVCALTLACRTSRVTFSTPVAPGDAAPLPPHAFDFVARGERFHVDPQGRVTSPRGALQLPLDGHLTDIDALQFIAAPRDTLIVLYEVSDGESGAGRVARVSLEPPRVLWVASLPSFNVGPAALDGASLYVSSLGFAGALNVVTGTYRWKHEHLYDRAHINGFARPRVLADRVIFDEDGAPHRLVVDKNSGRATFTTRASSAPPSSRGRSRR